MKCGWCGGPSEEECLKHPCLPLNNFYLEKQAEEEHFFEQIYGDTND